MKNINNNLSCRITHHSSSRYSPYGRMRDIVVGYFNAPLYPGLQISGMTNGRGAFTLIELLVVVLIIGILAAVAVPQYQKAVEKSRAAQALTMLKSVAQAAEAYYLANGTEFTSFDELALDVPWPTGTQVIGIAQETRSDGQWALEVENASSISTTILFITRLNGKYKGAGFAIDLRNAEHVGTLNIRCFERKSGATILFDTSLPAGSYCAQMMKGTLSSDGQWSRSYSLP